MPPTTKPANKPAAKPAAPAKPAALPKQPSFADRSVVHPTVEARVCDGDGALTEDQAKLLLRWQTRQECFDQLRAKNARLKSPGDIAFEADFTDLEGNGVKCWNNCRNRPFDLDHAKELAQVILNRGWAGPTTMPGKTINGEPAIIGRTGIILSGQHSLIGFILACQDWRRDEYWRTLWPTPPVLEKLLVFGIDESQDILKTFDNVRARKASDTFYTSDIFQALPPAGRKECSRMLEAALKLLWKRLGCGESKHEHYQTIDASYNLLNRHKRLNECIKHLFETNEDRQISNLRLSAGQCAAAMYLMASSVSDGETYRNDAQPDERLLNFDRWARAEEFFTLLASGADFKPVRDALGKLFVPGEGIGGRVVEKLAVLALAWQKFGVEGVDPTVKDCSLESLYDRDPQGNITGLSNAPTFGGIDRGEKPEPREADVPPEEVEQSKEEIRRAKAAEMVAAASAVREGAIPTGAQQLRDEWNGLRDAFPARPVIAKFGALYRSYFEDAERIGKALDRQCLKHPDGMRIQFSPDEIEEVVAALRAKRVNVAVCDREGKELYPAAAPRPNGAKLVATRTPPAKPVNGKAAAAKAPTRKPAAKK